MKISLDQLLVNEPRHIRVEGSEEWLESLYSGFPPPAGAEQPRLSGELELLRLEGDYVRLTGRFAYTPFVHCSRCDAPIEWAISEKLDICFMPDPPKAYAAERDLTASELEEYYLEADGTLDLEATLNEAVILAIPARTIPAEDAGHDCQLAPIDGHSDRLYSSEGPPVEPNPFAVLKGLKLND